MFPEFNKSFQNIYQSVAITWISFWMVINIFNYGANLIQFETMRNSKFFNMGQWFFQSFGAFIGLLLGLVIIFLLVSINGSINKRKAVTSNGILLAIGVIYFLLPTLTDAFGMALFNPSEFTYRVPQLFIWLLPSMTFAVFHILNFINTNKYQSEYEINLKNQ